MNEDTTHQNPAEDEVENPAGGEPSAEEGATGNRVRENCAGEEPNLRRRVARHLTMIGMMHLHHLHGAMRSGPGAPWLDPRQGQGRVLALLKLQPETTQRELTFLLGMSRQSLAELLAKLERQGLVEREPSSQDRRVVVVRLTAAGRAAEQTTGHADEPSAELLGALDDEEVASLSGYLERILDHIDQEWRDADGRRSRGGFGRGQRGFGRGAGSWPGPWFPGAGPRGLWGPGSVPRPGYEGPDPAREDSYGGPRSARREGPCPHCGGQRGSYRGRRGRRDDTDFDPRGWRADDDPED